MNVRRGILRTAWVSIPMLVGMASTGSPTQEDCLLCHGDTVSAKAFQASPHAARGCAACHPAAAQVPHTRSPRIARSEIPILCAGCHGDPGKLHPSHALSEMAPVGSYALTVHGQAVAAGRLNAAVCTDCHGSHAIQSSSKSGSRVHRNNIPDTCGRCHRAERAAYGASVHGRAARDGIKEAPVCTDCHGEHTIRSPRDPASSVWAGAVTRTCSRCHDSERIALKFGLPVDRVTSYLDTYHGLASRRGALTVANCASCHGTHDVLPASDPASRVHPSRLAATCGRCHPGAAAVLAASRVHGSSSATHRLVRIAQRFYLAAIPLIVGGMALFVGLDWWRKARHGVPPSAEAGPEEPRLTRHERWQHGVLALSFLVLAWSGFALKFPDMWWGAPFQWLGGEAARRWAHRAGAIAFGALALWHLAYLLSSQRGRAWAVAMLPGLGDFQDAARLAAHNLGRGQAPLLHDAGGGKPRPYATFIEKAEYLALVWGGMVMLVTGIVLACSTAALRHLPLWGMDLATVVHLYEAVLACLSILIWHGYWTVFDPAVYPMNWAWLTGRVRRPPCGGDER